MQVTKTTLTLRSGWFWLPVFSILIFESGKPADNAIRAVAGQRARLLLTFVKHKAKPDR